jgi:hypothetical protein
MIYFYKVNGSCCTSVLYESNNLNSLINRIQECAQFKQHERIYGGSQAYRVYEDKGAHLICLKRELSDPGYAFQATDELQGLVNQLLNKQPLPSLVAPKKLTPMLIKNEIERLPQDQGQEQASDKNAQILEGEKSDPLLSQEWQPPGGEENPPPPSQERQLAEDKENSPLFSQGWQLPGGEENSPSSQERQPPSLVREGGLIAQGEQSEKSKKFVEMRARGAKSELGASQTVTPPKPIKDLKECYLGVTARDPLQEALDILDELFEQLSRDKSIGTDLPLPHEPRGGSVQKFVEKFSSLSAADDSSPANEGACKTSELQGVSVKETVKKFSSLSAADDSSPTNGGKRVTKTLAKVPSPPPLLDKDTSPENESPMLVSVERKEIEKGGDKNKDDLLPPLNEEEKVSAPPAKVPSPSPLLDEDASSGSESSSLGLGPEEEKSDDLLSPSGQGNVTGVRRSLEPLSEEQKKDLVTQVCGLVSRISLSNLFTLMSKETYDPINKIVSKVGERAVIDFILQNKEILQSIRALQERLGFLGWKGIKEYVSLSISSKHQSLPRSDITLEMLILGILAYFPDIITSEESEQIDGYMNNGKWGELIDQVLSLAFKNAEIPQVQAPKSSFFSFWL